MYNRVVCVYFCIILSVVVVVVGLMMLKHLDDIFLHEEV